MPSLSATGFYPPDGFGAPKLRCGHASGDLGLPPGTRVFSADNHISLAEDIFYQRFPDEIKDQAPRIWYEDGAYQIGTSERSFLPTAFSAVLMQYDDLDGAGSADMPARIRQLRQDGMDQELAFPNSLLALLHYPDKSVRERAFRTYNEYIAELQEHSDGHFYGVGLINWWDPRGARRTLTELRDLGVTTFLLPLNPGKDDNGEQIDYTSGAMIGVWDEIEAAGLPVSHHIGETPLSSPCEVNSVIVGMLHHTAPFREMFGRYIFGGIIDRHPALRVGWFEGGISWVPVALQEAEHLLASYRHMLDRLVQCDVRTYWDNHMWASFMVDSLGLRMLDEIGIDKVMWSSDYPHNESTFGYSEKSIAAVVDAVGADAAAKIVGQNIRDFLGINTGVNR
jgi:predicted TIM-barrel fold metal-dependent hydrolase